MGSLIEDWADCPSGVDEAWSKEGATLLGETAAQNPT